MNHYGTLESAQTYHELRHNMAWLNAEVTDAQKTAALIRASSALDGVYSDKFGGVKTGGRQQLLSWPRICAMDYCANEVIPDDEVPTGIIHATYELALVELINPGTLAPSVTPGRVVKRQKVDSIEREFFGSDNGVSAESMRPVLLAVEDALKCLISPSKGGQVFLLRY